MRSIELSFIIPVFNVAALLDRCLSTVVAQDLRRGAYEVILVDDGSTDESLAVAERWRDAYPEVQVVAQPNRGPSAARNAGLDLATGSYVWFIDSDDFVARGCAPTLLRHAVALDLDVLAFDRVLVKPTAPTDIAFDAHLVPSPVQDGITYFIDHRFGRAPWNYLIRREYLDERGMRFLEGHLLEDVIFSLPLVTCATRVSHYPSTPYAYVGNLTGYTRARTPAQQIRMIEAMRFVLEFLDRFVEDQTHNAAATPLFLRRVRSLQDDYTLFLGIRLLRSPLSEGEKLAIYSDLCDQRRVPLVNLDPGESPRATLRALAVVINHRPSFRGASLVVRLSHSVRRLVGREGRWNNEGPVSRGSSRT